MRVLLLLLALTAGLAVAVHYQAPGWLARLLPQVDNSTEAFESVPPLEESSPWIAAYGRVEPVSEERALAFEISGLIESVSVKEGDPVRKGQVLANLRNEDYQAQLASAQAIQEARRATYEKLVAGARKEEKSEAWAAVERARLVMQNARVEMQRRKELLEKNLIAKEEVDRATRDFRVAQKQYEEAVQRHLIAKDQSRKEDIASAYAEFDAARMQAREREANLEKTLLRSPIDGVVLRTHRRAGENVSIFFESPVLTVGDTTEYNIRAEVDEKFAAGVKLGQSAFFVSDAFGNRRFEGRVVRLGRMTGKKKLPLDTPGDKADTEVLEVIVSMDEDRDLITGLTGDVFIKTGQSAKNR